MKKAYSLDYSIERDKDRVHAVEEILDKLDYDPSPTDLEQMASYILYGKDEEGKNSIQRGETTDQHHKRYNSYKTLDDKVISLDELLENPMMDEQSLRSAYQKNAYKKEIQKIRRPRINRKTGEVIDPGDSDIPGIIELWDTIDRLDKWIRQLEGKEPADENTLLFDDSYRLYRLKHILIDIRRHQYYLKDSYKPTLHFMAIDHPKTQFYDWSGDSFYWVSREQWQYKVDHAYTSTISKDLKDYETSGKGDQLEVKWMVCEHNFDWENPDHVRELMNNYEALYDYLREKLDTYGRTLIWDFERYRKLCNFSDLREFLIDHKLNQTPYDELLADLQRTFGITYNKNHLCCIMAQEIPKKIADTARRERLLIDTPDDQRKICPTCGRSLPVMKMFFSKNRSHKDGFYSRCKECEKQLRIEKGGQSQYDKRGKEQKVFEMQNGKTS